uniref:Ribosomal protein S11 n=1 Tax=Pelargonium transvaalense TaxID=158603 RepID=A0A1B0PY78_9ROSI|nr:ribosomal protein S11 [Pelargonium transvaalense]YP_009300179.1 ribosomal protein S11 [Pelargonium transvaalense]AJC00060.1 ribosomal protein S11 [Pelargonium transvaalense]AJC00094.1 ribosomal protein S11 [Pelargonium transvaalense]
MHRAVVLVKGVGRGRDAALRALFRSGVHFLLILYTESTPPKLDRP